MKKYVLIAGVNGAGKSTLYHILDELQGMRRINTDEIVSSFGCWNNPKDVERRYEESIRNLSKIISKCDKITFYDNTEYFERIAFYQDNKINLIANTIPSWMNKLLNSEQK